MQSSGLLIALLLVGFALDCGAGTDVSPPAPGVASAGGGRLEARPCWFDSEPDNPELTVDCAVLRVPERGDAAVGPEVSLPVVVLRTGSKSRWATLVPGGGGPGGSLGLESDAASVTVANHEPIAVASGGDLVLIDQRGAGIALPSFRCSEMSEATQRWLATNPSVDEEAALWSDAARRCRLRLEESGIALEAYDATAVARDFEALRSALGYEQWNLFGTSYGGEIALVYAREHPASVRALVLDSPSAPGAALVSPAWFQHVVDALFARCAADARCRRDFPALDAALDRLLRRFDAEPLELIISDPKTLAPIPVSITPVRLLDVIFVAMYDTQKIHELPLMLTAADRGSYDWLHQFVRQYVWSLLDPRFSEALLGAVPCREAVPYGDLARAEREAGLHRWARAFVGVERVTTAVCRAWDVDAAGAGAARPVGFGGPALLLAGRLDPVIPLEDIERVAQSLPRSTLIDFPATGHAPDATWWSCLDPLIGGFLADPDAPLDAQEIEDCRREAAATEFATLMPPESLPGEAASAHPRSERRAVTDPHLDNEAR